MGLNITIQKTREMRIGVRQQKRRELNGWIIEIVLEFTYLGNVDF